LQVGEGEVVRFQQGNQKMAGLKVAGSNPSAGLTTELLIDGMRLYYSHWKISTVEPQQSTTSL